MDGLTRHVGRITNTGARVAVVFRKIPGDEGFCLVIETDRLSDMYKDNVNGIVESRDAQATVDLYESLGRRTFADGLNCLQSLHNNGLLKKVAIAQIEMLPFPDKAVPLSLINEQIDGPATNPDELMVDEIVGDTRKKAPEAPVVESADPDTQASKLIERADIMEQTAAALKEEAYMLVPKMRPGRGRPKLTADEAAAKKEQRNEKRRAKYAEEQAAKNAK